jgi:hypothetical protein
MTKITGYATLAAAQSDDVLPIVDVHDTSMAASGTTKQIPVSALVPMPWVPGDNNLLVASGDPAAQTTANVAVAGTLYLIKLRARTAMTLSSLWFLMAVAGSGTSTGSFAGVYSLTGSRLTGSADIAAGFQATAPPQCALSSPQPLAAGTDVWAAVLLNMPVMPQLRSGVGNTGSPVNVGLIPATARWATNGTGLSALPSSFTPSANNTTGLTFWCGAS